MTQQLLFQTASTPRPLGRTLERPSVTPCEITPLVRKRSPDEQATLDRMNDYIESLERYYEYRR